MEAAAVSIEALIEEYGYPLILVGSMVEGQPVMVFGGFAAHRGHLQLVPWVILAGAVGNFLGLQGWYLGGRRFGRHGSIGGRNGRGGLSGCSAGWSGTRRWR